MLVAADDRAPPPFESDAGARRLRADARELFTFMMAPQRACRLRKKISSTPVVSPRQVRWRTCAVEQRAEEIRGCFYWLAGDGFGGVFAERRA